MERRVNSIPFFFSSPRWFSSLPFVLALAVLVMIVWGISNELVYPYDGITGLHPTGQITEISPNSPASGKLSKGDVILEIDGVPWTKAFTSYAGKRGGSFVDLIVQRQSKIFPVTIELANPPLGEVLERLTVLFVALLFWAIALGVQIFKPHDDASGIFFIWCTFSAILLTAGELSGRYPPWVSSLFNSLLWILGPLTVHFHLHFPHRVTDRRLLWMQYGLYLLAAMGAFPFVIWGSSAVSTSPYYPFMITAERLFLAFNLILMVGLLIRAYLIIPTPGVRGKVRIVALGGGISVSLVVSLSILPEALFHQPFVSYAYTFLASTLLPVTYGYAIFRYRLIEIEKNVNRSAAYLLVFSIFGMLYLICYSSLNNLLPETIAHHALTNAILVIILASIYSPLQQRIQRVVDTAFYGGWYDYRTAVTQITSGIEQSTDLKNLADTICNRLVKILHLEETCIFLRDLEGDFSVIAVALQDGNEKKKAREYPVLPRSSLTYLLKVGAAERNYLQSALSEVSLSPEENKLLSSEQVNLWVPIVSRNQVQGLIALGPKMGGDIFSSEDMDILRLIARQLGQVIENIHLITRLRNHAADLEQRVSERTAELFDAKERVEAILKSVGDGVVVTDLDGYIITVNHAYERQSGFDASEIAGQRLFQLLGLQNASITIEDMRISLARGEVWSGELLNQRKDGSVYDIQLSLAPVKDQHGRTINLVGSQRDITQQKELARLKDMFVADVSHELRTPTSNISLYLELMDDAPADKQREYLGIVNEQVQLLRRLVEDILDLSRLTIGKSRKNEFEPVDLNNIAQKVIYAHQAMADVAAIDLNFKPSPNKPKVNGDPDKMERLISNLVSNAVRYTIYGSVQIVTRCEDETVYLEVQDTGIGIEPEDLPHLFERFYRGRQVRQSKIHGTGLGLAIVKEIADYLHGTIQVQSELGYGSKFTVGFELLKS